MCLLLVCSRTSMLLRKLYDSPLKVLSELGINVNGGGKVYRDILDLLKQNSPVDVYECRDGKINSYLIPVSKKEQMKSYLREKLHENYAIIGVGGVMTPKDYFEYRKAGADLVQSATGAMWNPYLAHQILKAI